MVLTPALAAKMADQMAGLLGSVHSIEATAALADGRVEALLVTALEMTFAIALPAFFRCIIYWSS